MKINVKTLKGTHFEIQVNPNDTVLDVKKNIEVVQGVDVYPAVQQMLIHQGKVLKDESTLEENQVAENIFVVVVLSKTKVATAASSAPSNPAAQAASYVPPPSSTPQPPASTAKQGDSNPVQVPTVTVTNFLIF
ncbi:hypothetical protein RYX36_019778 [Vicia faba]